MKPPVLLSLALLAIVVLAGATWATHNANHGGEPSPTTTSSTPAASGYFTIHDGRVRPTQNVTDYEWYNVEIRALILGVHYNLNQPARVYDSSADAWSRVFTAQGASFTTNDYVAFCGPQASFTIQARDKDSFNGIGEATLTGVPACN